VDGGAILHKPILSKEATHGWSQLPAPSHGCTRGICGEGVRHQPGALLQRTVQRNSRVLRRQREDRAGRARRGADRRCRPAAHQERGRPRGRTVANRLGCQPVRTDRSRSHRLVRRPARQAQRSSREGPHRTDGARAPRRRGRSAGRALEVARAHRQLRRRHERHRGHEQLAEHVRDELHARRRLRRRPPHRGGFGPLGGNTL